MLDYLALQGSTENPTLVTILFTILLSFILSSLIAFTYEKTTKQVLTPVDFLQALILVSIVAATVMQAIGDSLARGLGMLGALAIIRFRTNLRSPRNMAFMFASLAVGIACGVYGFVIGIIGAIGFCLVAFVLKHSSLSKMSNLVGILKFELPKSSDELAELEKILTLFCKRYAKIRYQIQKSKNKHKNIENIVGETIILPSLPTEKVIAYEYHLKLKNSTDGGRLDTALSQLKTIKSVKLNFENSPEIV